MNLTERQEEIINLIGEGLSTDEIADALDLSRWTIRDHVKTLCARFVCPMRELPEAVRIARERERPDPEEPSLSAR